MLHNDAAQQRAGEQPASAPTASQKFPRAQTAAKLKIPTLKQANSRHGDIVATGLRDWGMDAMPIHIYGKHSPPPRPTTHNTATHATMQWPLHPDGLMASPPLAHMYQRQPARYHSLGDGHVQAHSVFGPELGTGQQQQPEAQQQHPHCSTQNLHHSSMDLPHPARHQPPGEGRVQTGSALIPEQCTGQQQLLRAATDAVTQDNATHATMQWPLHPDGPMVSPPLAHMYQRQPARYHPLGDGHVQAHSVLGPELGTGQQQHPHYSTQILHHSPMALPHPARHQLPGEEHVQPGSALLPEQSTGQQQPLRAATDAALQHLNGRMKKSLIAAPQYARHQPLGEGYGQVRPALEQGQATERQWPDPYGTMELQQNRDHGKTPQSMTEPSNQQLTQNKADPVTHCRHGTSSVERHSLKRTASFHGTTEPNDALGANSSWSAQVQPFGTGAATQIRPPDLCSRVNLV